MAKLIEQSVTIKFSKLVRDDKFDPAEVLVTDSLIENIEETLQGLVSEVVLVEAKVLEKDKK